MSGWQKHNCVENQFLEKEKLGIGQTILFGLTNFGHLQLDCLISAIKKQLDRAFVSMFGGQL
ncbi:MAG: hypothetical protein DHS20C18_46620 [Saprospiraceae bacterium]|nr:MAG: hypothetical protein DHS20C18_46620 [Saprospiraceae bacterium]